MLCSARVLSVSLGVALHLACIYTVGKGTEETGKCTLIKGGKVLPILPEIFGYNQINGAIYNENSFDDEILKKAPQVLWGGQMRFPGGTVGNFWYMPNATYSHVCQIGGGDAGGGNSHGVSKDFCDNKARVDKLPGFTFSTRKFVEAFGSSSPVNSPKGALYVLNVLGTTKQEIRRQIDHLQWVAQTTRTKVSQLEFGNELFLMSDKFYKSVIPDADTYWQKVRDGLEYAKNKFGDEVIRIVPFAYPFCSGGCHSKSRDEWNRALNENHHLFEAVAIHEYTGCTDSIDSIERNKRIQSMLAWGDAALARQTRCVQEFDNLMNKPIWITEWSIANFKGVPLWGDPKSPDPTPFSSIYQTKIDVATSAVNGIFKAAHLLKAMARSHDVVNPVKAMHHQLLNDADYSGYGKGAGLTQIREDGLYISPAGQIVSHLSWIALKCSQRYREVTPKNCGDLGFEVNTESGLGCLQAVAFEHQDRIMPYYAVINRCDEAIAVQIDTSALKGRTHLKLRKVTYGWSMTGDSYKKVADLKRYYHPWRDGPIKLSEQNKRITYKPPPLNNQATVVVWKKSLSIIDFISHKKRRLHVLRTLKNNTQYSFTLPPTPAATPAPTPAPALTPTPAPTPGPTPATPRAPALVPTPTSVLAPTPTPAPSPASTPAPTPGTLVPSSSPTTLPEVVTLGDTVVLKTRSGNGDKVFLI